MTWLALGRAALGALRWLIGSREGRIALIVVVSVAVFLEYGHRRYAAGRAGAVAECQAAAASARANAAQAVITRDTSAQVIGDKAQADTAGRIEQGNTATTAAQGRTNARIQAQPAVAGCAGPDPGVMRDVQAADGRVRAAANRMRRIGATAPR